MSDALRLLRALPLAAADLAVGVVLARHVSVTAGIVLGTFGVLVLCTVAYRAARRDGRAESGRRQPA
jgi:heme/copper-type cytochrome/quinol oxidase subunit 2